ncbi:MAG: hypothetical protein ACK53L_07215 [Pirellulaceae bacterium]
MGHQLCPSPPEPLLGQLKRSAAVGCGGFLGFPMDAPPKTLPVPLEFSDGTHGAGPVAGNCRAAPPADRGG